MGQFIDDQRDAYGVASICTVVPIAPSPYCWHKARHADPMRRSARVQRDDEWRRENSARLGRQPAGIWPAHGLAATATRGPPRGALYGGPPDARDGPPWGLSEAVRG